MKRAIVMVMALFVSASLSAELVDGNWLKAGFCAEGDSVCGEVKQRIADYATAKKEAYAIVNGEADGDLRDAQRRCVETTLYSYVKAMYTAEMGRRAKIAGDLATAKADYLKALAYAETALIVDTKEESKTAESKRQGAIIKRVSEKALSKL